MLEQVRVRTLQARDIVIGEQRRAKPSAAMQPVRELLDQIRWDPNFRGEFEIAFVDHTKPELERVAVRDLRFDPDDRSSFEFVDRQGDVLSIPLHRIRQVYRDGELIWSRPE